MLAAWPVLGPFCWARQPIIYPPMPRTGGRSVSQGDQRDIGPSIKHTPDYSPWKYVANSTITSIETPRKRPSKKNQRSESKGNKIDTCTSEYVFNHQIHVPQPQRTLQLVPTPHRVSCPLAQFRFSLGSPPGSRDPYLRVRVSEAKLRLRWVKSRSQSAVEGTATPSRLQPPGA